MYLGFHTVFYIVIVKVVAVKVIVVNNLKKGSNSGGHEVEVVKRGQLGKSMW